jgi:DnaK suppressor protein
MNDDALEQIKKNLYQMRSELQALEQSSGESKETVDLDQAKIGRLSRMDAMQIQQMALEETRRRQQKLIKIEGALGRIESGEYGECYICGEEIDMRRLFFDATNTRCVACVGK